MRWFAMALTACLAPALALAGPQALRSEALGLEIWHQQEQAAPMIAVEASFPGGAATDPEGKTGRASFLAGMLDEGAGDLDSAAFNDRKALLGLRMRARATPDDFRLSLRMLRENAEESAALVNLALTDARVDDEPLRRVRGQILSGLRADAQDPRAIAGDAMGALLFPDDPYGARLAGTPESVAAIGAEDLRAARPALLTLDGASVSVVGDIDAAGAVALVETLFSGLSDARPPEAAPVAPQGAGAVALRDFAGPQSTVLFAQSGPLRDDPDFLALHVVNHILGGGGFSSRLTEEVREKRGLAYGVYSYLSPMERAGLWRGGVATANERVAESIRIIRQEWARMRDAGVTAEELAKAKTNLTGAWALNFDSNADVAGVLLSAQRQELGLDYLTERNGLIEALTLDEVNRVAREWLDPDALRFVVVGQPEGLDAP